MPFRFSCRFICLPIHECRSRAIYAFRLYAAMFLIKHAAAAAHARCCRYAAAAAIVTPTPPPTDAAFAFMIRARAYADALRFDAERCCHTPPYYSLRLRHYLRRQMMLSRYGFAVFAHTRRRLRYFRHCHASCRDSFLMPRYAIYALLSCSLVRAFMLGC